MVYPIFEINSILERFKKDMNQFKTNYENDIKKYDLVVYIDQIENSIQVFNDSNKTYMDFKMNIDGIKEKINKIRKNDLTQFDYSHDITHFNHEDQILLWCLRTLLFYQLLIIATLMMQEETIFNGVYQNYDKKRIFNPNVIDELRFYKMGIFGSITPTSDIDIGIQYSGSNPQLIGLSYIVSVFEDLFLIFTGINSLHFDIETYADMMTIPNLDEKTNKEHPDVFYLDTTHFKETHFQSMIPFIESSILRNYVTAQLAIDNKNSINDIINSFSYNEFNKSVPGIHYSVKQFYLKNTKFGYSNEENTNITLNDETIKMVSDYMNSSYDEAREKYYKYVIEAEESLIHVKNNYKQTNEVVLTPEEIVVIMQNIAKSLIYRAESYTCAPTVMHVVRVLQANIGNPNKYDTLKPGYCITNKNKDAYCSIGIYGYLISIYEQFGYLYRFYITYCNKNVPLGYDADKCNKKEKKYRERFDNANKFIKSKMRRDSNYLIISNKNKTNGGKKNRKTKNNIKKKIDIKTLKRRKYK